MRWILFGAVLVPCLYLFTLSTPFDFIDDSCLVYPTAAASPLERLEVVWYKIWQNYNHLGPFRPVLWAHWETAADLFGAHAPTWRVARLAWLMLAVGMFLWWLHELRVPRNAALLTALIAFWNPYRNEIWTSLTLSEGVAMPYALLALVSAVRAGRSQRAWRWDLLGAFCVLMALGCKNTFMALVPVQMLLRIAPDGQNLREGWRRHGRAACFLTLPLILPLAHFVYFKLNWHPGQYVTKPITLGHTLAFGNSILGAIGIDFLGVALGLIGLTFWLARRRQRADDAPASEGPTASERTALRAGLALLLLGTLIYLPMGAISGRYTMPAVWGLDVLIALMLTRFMALPAAWCKRVATAALAVGLVALALAHYGRQTKFAARARLLWQVAERIEQQAPPGCCITWRNSAQLNVEEGINLVWHLHSRGRDDIGIRLIDAHGQTIPRFEIVQSDDRPQFLVSGYREPGAWSGVEKFHETFWHGRRDYSCYVHVAPPATDKMPDSFVAHE